MGFPSRDGFPVPMTGNPFSAENSTKGRIKKNAPKIGASELAGDILTAVEKTGDIHCFFVLVNGVKKKII